MRDDDSIYIDPMNKYVHVPLTRLRRDYVAIEVVGSPTSKNSTMSSGKTNLFWVVGNGSKTLVYRTSGNAEIVSNKDFDFVRVMDAQQSMVVDGRILYLPADEGAEWEDLGPIEAHALSDSDPNFKEICKAHLKRDVDAEDKADQADNCRFLSLGSSSKGKW